MDIVGSSVVRCEQGLAVHEAFTAFAVIELSRRSAGAQARQRGQIERPS